MSTVSEAILNQLRQSGAEVGDALVSRLGREVRQLGADVGRELDNRFKELIDELNGDLIEQEKQEEDER